MAEKMEKSEQKWAKAAIAKDEDAPESDSRDTSDSVFV